MVDAPNIGLADDNLGLDTMVDQVGFVCVSPCSFQYIDQRNLLYMWPR